MVIITMRFGSPVFFQALFRSQAFNHVTRSEMSRTVLGRLCITLLENGALNNRISSIQVAISTHYGSYGPLPVKICKSPYLWNDNTIEPFIARIIFLVKGFNIQWIGLR